MCEFNSINDTDLIILNKVHQANKLGGAYNDDLGEICHIIHVTARRCMTHDVYGITYKHKKNIQGGLNPTPWCVGQISYQLA